MLFGLSQSINRSMYVSFLFALSLPLPLPLLLSHTHRNGKFNRDICKLETPFVSREIKVFE